MTLQTSCTYEHFYVFLLMEQHPGPLIMIVDIFTHKDPLVLLTYTDPSTVAVAVVTNTRKGSLSIDAHCVVTTDVCHGTLIDV